MSDFLSSGTWILLIPFLVHYSYSLLHSLWFICLQPLCPWYLYLRTFWFLFPLSAESSSLVSFLPADLCEKIRYRCPLGDRVFCCGSC